MSTFIIVYNNIITYTNVVPKRAVTVYLHNSILTVQQAFAVFQSFQNQIGTKKDHTQEKYDQ